MADDLRTRESVRRKALWTLSHLMPGDPKAAAILDVLDGIEDQERVDLNRRRGNYPDAGETLPYHQSGPSHSG